MIKIDFEQQTEFGVFRDAITLPDDHAFSAEQIEQMKQKRVDNWVNFLRNPPQPEPEPEYVEVDGVRYVKVQ